MKAVGITAEYNPFHLGHAHHIAQTRALLGEDKPVVCVMSGSWVQRGECALADKWTRAGLALEGGADLVLELPLPWAISSAEGFARGAVAVLEATGVVDTISFGSESGDLASLRVLAAGLESEAYRNALRAELDKGISFAEARQRALVKCVGKRAELLRGPNDSLGVEYLRATGGRLGALAIVREGVSHDSDSPAGGFASASALRELAKKGKWDEMVPWRPAGAPETLKAVGIADRSRIQRAVLARLRTMGEADFAALPDSGVKEGLPARLVRAAGEAESLEEFYRLAKTRRYVHARLRRLAIWAFLGLTAADRPARPEYLRVLGTNGRGMALLREMKSRVALPILTKPAHISEFPPEAQRLFALERRGTDLYGLCFETVRPGGLDYSSGPVILEQGPQSDDPTSLF